LKIGIRWSLNECFIKYSIAIGKDNTDFLTEAARLLLIDKKEAGSI